MKRLRKIIFNGLTVLSLLLCVAVCVRALGADFPSFRDWCWWVRDGDCYTVINREGGEQFQRVSGWPSQLPADQRLVVVNLHANPVAAIGGFYYYRETINYYSTALPLSVRTLILPHWFLIALTAALPAWFAGWHIRRIQLVEYRKTDSLCPVCGYDLRASSNRCPECGASVVRGF